MDFGHNNVRCRGHTVLLYGTVLPKHHWIINGMVEKYLPSIERLELNRFVKWQIATAAEIPRIVRFLPQISRLRPFRIREP